MQRRLTLVKKEPRETECSTCGAESIGRVNNLMFCGRQRCIDTAMSVAAEAVMEAFRRHFAAGGAR